MSEENRIYTVLEEHRRETRQQFSKLEDVLTQLGTATSQLAISTALMEERYHKSDKEMTDVRDSIKGVGERIGKVEQDMAVLESKTSASWKTLTVVGSAAATFAMVGTTVFNAVITGAPSL